jgi:hypothetical protein
MSESHVNLWIANIKVAASMLILLTHDRRLMQNCEYSA